MSKKRKSRFGSNVSRTAEREKNKSKGFSYLNVPKGIEMYDPPFGEVKLDIIPYKVTDKHHPDYFEGDPDSAVAGDLWYRRPFSIHRNIGVEKETVVCPKTIGKKCSICEEKDKQYKDNVPSDDVVGKSSFRSLYIVIPKSHKDYEEVPHLWDISQYCFGDELNEELEEKEQHNNFPELDGGKTLEINFKKKKFGKSSEFAFAKRVKFLKRKKAYPESILDGLPSLDDLFIVRSYKDLQRLFFEMDDEDEDDVAEEDTSSKDKKKRKKKGDDGKKQKDRPSPDFSEKSKKDKKKEKKK